MASDKRLSRRAGGQLRQHSGAATEVHEGKAHDGILPIGEHGLTFGINAKCACTFVRRWWLFLVGIELKTVPRGVYGVLLNLQESRSDLFVDDPANFHIAFIRNPLERIRSAYAEKVGNPRYKGVYIGKHLSFGNWIESLLSDVGNQEKWNEHWRPQSVQLRAHRWDRFVDIDVDLESAVRSIERELKLPELKYDHIHKKRIPKPAVSEELASMILQIYEADFEFFDRYCPAISEGWLRGPVAEEDYFFLDATAAPSEAAATPAVERARRRRHGPASGEPENARLTLGMATFDDYDGVYFTVQAVHLYHREVAGEIEFLVVDNHPGGASAEPLRKLASWIPGYRYLASRDIRGTAVRDLIFRQARTPYVLCVDSHVLLVPGALRKLIDYLDDRPEFLVIEDDAIFLEDTLDHLRRSVTEIVTQDWKVFHLGGHRWGRDFPKAEGCSHLLSPCAALTCTQVVAYDRSVFPKILADLPADQDGMREWIKTHHAIDIYLRAMEKRFLSHPSVASQPALLAQEDPESRDRFTLGNAGPKPESPALLTGEHTLRLRPDVEVAVSRDEVVLSDPASGQILSLNPTAAVLVDQLDGERSVAEVKSLLQAAYPESAELVARDVEQTLASLLRHGALVTSSAANE